MYLDKRDFNNKCQEVVKDTQSGKMTSSAWPWLIGGALTGLIASCIRKKRPVGKPILGTFKRTVGGESGKFNR